MPRSHSPIPDSVDKDPTFNLDASTDSISILNTDTHETPVHSSTHRQAKRKQRKRRTELDPGEDGYRWHKYGQKTLMDTTFIRGYFRCAQKGTGCQAKKMVDNHASGHATLRITYDGQHNHPTPHFSKESVLSKVNYFSNATALTRHPSGVSSITTADQESGDEEPTKQGDLEGENANEFNLNFIPLNSGVQTKAYVSTDFEHPFHSNNGDNFSLSSFEPNHSNLNSNFSLVNQLRDSFGAFEYGAQLRYASQMQPLTPFPQIYRTSSVNSVLSLPKIRELSTDEELKLDLSLSLPY